MDTYDRSSGGPRFNIIPIIIGIIAVGVVALKGCQPGPFGRHQVVGLNATQEAQLGAQSYREVLSKSEVVRGGPLVDAVQRIGLRLARASEDPEVLKRLRLKPQEFDWQFEVVRSNQVNAFCLPGGKVVVYTGIVPVAKTDAGLATVMGHEIGHALAHHGAERMAQARMVQMGTLAVASSVGNIENSDRARLMAMLGVGSQYGLVLPFARKHESEADHIGILLMAAAGYDPREATEFWKRMEQAGGRGPAEFMSTHPSHEHRARDLQGWLSEAMPLYEMSDKATNRPLPGI